VTDRKEKANVKKKKANGLPRWKRGGAPPDGNPTRKGEMTKVPGNGGLLHL